MFLGVFGFLVLDFVLSFVLVYNVLGVFWASLVPLLQEFWQDPLYILVSPIYLYIYVCLQKIKTRDRWNYFLERQSSTSYFNYFDRFGSLHQAKYG
jgi:hypothetical protein